MESKSSLLLIEGGEDANISLFRRRNKIILLIFSFLIISSAVIIAALIVELLRIHTQSHGGRVPISPITSFCSVSTSQAACLKAFIPIVNNRVIMDPDQILTISLQTSVFQIHNIINSSILSHSGSNCTNALGHALSQLAGPLAKMQLNPFVSSLTHDERGAIRGRIVAAEDDVRSCIDELAEVDQLPAGGVAAAEKLAEVEVYLNRGQDFLFRYANVMRNWGTDFVITSSYFQRSLIYDNLFEIGMCGLQVLFMFGMFCALFRIR